MSIPFMYSDYVWANMTSFYMSLYGLRFQSDLGCFSCFVLLSTLIWVKPGSIIRAIFPCNLQRLMTNPACFSALPLSLLCTKILYWAGMPSTFIRCNNVPQYHYIPPFLLPPKKGIRGLKKPYISRACGLGTLSAVWGYLFRSFLYMYFYICI